MKPVIGMEIHVELKTKSKMFCSCPAEHFGVEPNTHTCPVCLGMPGALPVPNRKAVDWTIIIGLALNCTIAKNSKFDRKHYFYPDLPKGYQISQYDEPLCFKGNLDTSAGPVTITRVHLEEDTAKLQHLDLDGNKVSLVDFNRSSVPLVEIVSEPDITSARQAKEYAQKIHQMVRFLDVSDADMEKGSMRVEANISWGLDLGYKVEVKNINSFRFLEKAIDYELARQKELLDRGITPQQETRGWSEAKNATYSQRTKEEAADYRYFPEPDIPPMIFTDEEINRLKQAMPQLPEVYRQHLLQLGIREDFVTQLISTQAKAQFALSVLTLVNGNDRNLAVNLLINKSESFSKTPEQILDEVKAKAAKPTASSSAINQWIDTTIAANPDIVAKYQAGKTAVIGVLVGEVMRASKGQADAKTVSQLLQEKLAK